MFLLEVMLLNFCAFKFNMVGAAVPIFVHFVAKGTYKYLFFAISIYT
jgi:hypothetical protein